VVNLFLDGCWFDVLLVRRAAGSTWCRVAGETEWLVRLGRGRSMSVVCPASVWLVGPTVRRWLTPGNLWPGYSGSSGSLGGIRAGVRTLSRILRDDYRPVANIVPESDIFSRVAVKTQYVVVNPPPRYEIVGLLQQRSYTAVNGNRSVRTVLPTRIPC
jgi:hypothetical protein